MTPADATHDGSALPSAGEASEIVDAGGRTLPLSDWEAEVLVRAAGWIFLYRGAGLAVSATLGLLILGQTHRTSPLALCAVAVGAASYAVGLAAFTRRRWAPVLAALVTLCWGAMLLATWMPKLMGDPAWPAYLGLYDSPPLRVFLNLFLLSDVFAVYALVRSPGRMALGKGKPPLASLWGRASWRLTGRVFVASGMLVLAFLSMGAMLLFGPGLVAA